MFSGFSDLMRIIKMDRFEAKYRSGHINIVMNVTGETLLHAASRAGKVHEVKFLITEGAKKDAKNKAGQTPLDVARQSGHNDIAEILADDNYKAEKRDNWGQTDLHRACYKGDIEGARSMIDGGANVYSRTTNASNGEEYEQLPVHTATRNGHLEIIEILANSPEAVRVGGYLKEIDKNGWTPLHLASNNGRCELVTYLIAKGVDLNARTNMGETALIIAVKSGHKDVINALADAECSKEESGKWGQTALHNACYIGNLDLVTFLIDKGSKIDARTTEININGNMSDYAQLPVHTAARQGHVEIVDALNRKHPCLEEEDGHGWTPLHLAASNGRCELVKHLIAKGVKIGAKTGRGKTALDLAKENNRKEVVAILNQALPDNLHEDLGVLQLGGTQ